MGSKGQDMNNESNALNMAKIINDNDNDDTDNEDPPFSLPEFTSDLI